MTKAEQQVRDRKLKKLKKDLQTDLGKAATSGPVWKQLEDEGHIDIYLCDQRPLEHVKEEAQRLLQFKERVIEQGGGRPRPPTRKEFVEIELDERERSHAEALKHYLVRQAAALPQVRQFRDEKLRGDLLTPDQAEEFLRAEELKDRPEEEPDENFSYAGHVYGLPREVLEDLVIPSLSKDGYFSEESAYYSEKLLSSVWFRNDDEEIDLGHLSLYLASVYPWEPEDAAWFVLTGEPPEVVSVHLTYHPRRGVFSLTFAPWISEPTLRQAYRKARDRTHSGKDNRNPGRKALAVLRFVSERTPPGKKPKWTQLMKTWNIKCRNGEYQPEWTFNAVQTFRNTYLRSEQRAAT